MQVIEVPGATGYIDTNFDGKAAAAIEAFKQGADLVYVHVEAPDECGHRGEVQNKVRSIELIDSKILGPVQAALAEMGDYRIMVLPDHPTPLAIKTHSADPVPFMIYDSTHSRTRRSGLYRKGRGTDRPVLSAGQQTDGAADRRSL